MSKLNDTVEHGTAQSFNEEKLKAAIKTGVHEYFADVSGYGYEEDEAGFCYDGVISYQDLVVNDRTYKGLVDEIARHVLLVIECQEGKGST